MSTQRAVQTIGIFAMTLLLISLPEPVAAQAGKSGFALLKLGVSARGAAMADAMAAEASGAAAPYYNPAAMLNNSAPGSTASIMLTHREWIEDTRVEFMGTTILLDEDNALGFAVTSTSVADIQIRTRPGEPEGTFTARNYALGASFARRFSEVLSFGLSAKFLYEKILIDEASGFGFDAGIHFKTPVERLTVGVALSNIGSVSDLRNEKTKLPSLIRSGAAYALDIPHVQSVLTLTSEVWNILPDGTTYGGIGGEWLFDHIVAARAGYHFGSESRKLTAGIGFRYSLLSLDYAYSPLADDLGNGHIISLTVSF